MKALIVIAVVLSSLAVWLFAYEYKTSFIMEKEAYEVVKSLFE